MIGLLQNYLTPFLVCIHLSIIDTFVCAYTCMGDKLEPRKGVKPFSNNPIEIGFEIPWKKKFLIFT